MKNPGVYRGSKDIDIAIIWPTLCGNIPEKKISSAQLIEKTLLNDFDIVIN
jgi:hypothetical protein